MSFVGARLEGRNVGHFILDLWFYIDDGNAPQALEFDVNQAFGGTRWTWGSECDFNKTVRWNLWDHLHGEWIPTWVDCHHFHRKRGSTWCGHSSASASECITPASSVVGQNYPIDTNTAEPKSEEIDIPFQIDGNHQQQRYRVWSG